MLSVLISFSTVWKYQISRVLVLTASYVTCIYRDNNCDEGYKIMIKIITLILVMILTMIV